MKTYLGGEIHADTLGVVYLCDYDHSAATIKVVQELQFKSAGEALHAYANIPNPESQMAGGSTKEQFESQLTQLHSRLNDPEWVKELAEYL